MISGVSASSRSRNLVLSVASFLTSLASVSNRSETADGDADGANQDHYKKEGEHEHEHGPGPAVQPTRIWVDQGEWPGRLYERLLNQRTRLVAILGRPRPIGPRRKKA